MSTDLQSKDSEDTAKTNAELKVRKANFVHNSKGCKARGYTCVVRGSWDRDINEAFPTGIDPSKKKTIQAGGGVQSGIEETDLSKSRSLSEYQASLDLTTASNPKKA